MSIKSLDPKVLRERWMRLYMNLMGLKSRDPRAQAYLFEMSLKFAEMNEEMMVFFDVLEGHV